VGGAGGVPTEPPVERRLAAILRGPLQGAVAVREKSEPASHSKKDRLGAAIWSAVGGHRL
jgi:hypothetical protein